MVVQGQGTTCYGWSNMFGEQRSPRVPAVHPFMGGLSLIELAHSSEGKAGEGPRWPSAEWLPPKDHVSHQARARFPFLVQ